MVETFAPAFIDTLAPSDGNSILNVATVVAKTSADMMADVGKVAAIPGLGLAGHLVKGIITHCETAANNKREQGYLSRRCYQYFMVLGTNCEKRKRSYVDEVVKKAYPTLKAVHDKIQSWNWYGKFKKFALAAVISSGIKSCEKLLDEMMMQTGVDIALRNADWQVAAEEARQRDQEDLRHDLEDFMQVQLDTTAAVHTLEQEMATMIQQNEIIIASNEYIENAMRYVMDCFQKCIEISGEENGNRGTLEFKLLNIQQATGQLPSITRIPPVLVRRLHSDPVMSPFQQYDIWKGTWSGGLEVSIKALRIHTPSEANLTRFWREARCWRDVWEVDQGRHFLEFIGAVEGPNGVLSLVSPWQSKGTAIDYCTLHPELDCTDIIRGIAAGLQILHKWEPKSIVCGDIRGKNIMIGNDGQPLIADFSLSKVLEDSTGVRFTQSGMSESYRWFAPEVCRPGDWVVSTASDVFSFGMTILELTTAEVPFVEERRTTTVLFRVADEERPARPVGQFIHRGLTDHMWQLVEDCWRQDQADRCSIDDFITRLG